MGALGKFQGCFKSFSHFTQEGFKSNFKQVSREVSKGFQVSFIEVLKCLIEFKALARAFQCFLKFIVACHSSQLPEQKEGLFLWRSSLTRSLCKPILVLSWTITWCFSRNTIKTILGTPMMWQRMNSSKNYCKEV